MVLLNRCTWDHILANASQFLGLYRDGFLRSRELAALDGKASPEGVIMWVSTRLRDHTLFEGASDPVGKDIASISASEFPYSLKPSIFSSAILMEIRYTRGKSLDFSTQ